MKFLSFITIYLYFISTLIFIKILYFKKINFKKHITSPLLITVIMLLPDISTDVEYVYWALFFIPIQILLLYSLTNVKLHSIVFLFFIIFSINSILGSYIAIISACTQKMTIIVDLCTSLFTTLLLLLFTIKKNHTMIFLYNTLSFFHKGLIFLILLFDMILMALIIDNSFYASQASWLPFLLKVAVTVVMITFILISILLYATISNTRLKQLTENYEKQINIQSEHYKKLAAANIDVRRFKHDFKNMSIAIEKLLSDGNTEEALNLLKSSVNSFDSHDNTINPFKSGNPIADALLADKQKMAHSAGATIEFEGAIPAERLSPIDICVLLGNTLDNAIEACQKFPHNIPKTIHISANCVGSIAFIMIENPVTEKANIKNNHIKTSKENKTLHGFGLYSLNSIVKKYSGTLKISSTDSKFTVEMSLFFNNPTKN